MSIVQCLDWAVGLFPRLLGMLQTFEFAEGVNFFNFHVALWIMLIIIVAFVPRP